MKNNLGLWRLLWYSVLVWLLTFATNGVVVMPWVYLVLPLVVLLATVYYFDKSEPVILISERKMRKYKDRIFTLGLIVSFTWFLTLVILDFYQLVNFYYFDLNFYFSDPRNWFLYPFVLLVPVIYSLFLEKSIFKKSKKKIKLASRQLQ